MNYSIICYQAFFSITPSPYYPCIGKDPTKRRMTENIEEKNKLEMYRWSYLGPEIEFQKLQREVNRNCSINDRATETAGARVSEWIDEWIAEFLPSHPSLKKDSR